ncbi:MAG: VWA domain-containing protein [Hyphomicrobiaceae bacterium]
MPRRLNMARRLARSQDGGVAIMFAFSFVLLMGFAGAAVDLGNVYRYKSRAQAALDAAVLAASNPLVESSERANVFRATFKANYGDIKPFPKTLEFKFVDGNGGTGHASFDVSTYLMGAMGFDQLGVDVGSSANFDRLDTEIVFVVDISGSMRNTRIDGVKTAANSLIDAVLAGSASQAKVRFAVVPFNMAVNIGTNMGAVVANQSHPLLASSGWGGCVLERPNGFHHKDVYNAGATDGSGQWPAYIWPPEPNDSNCLNPSNGTNSGYRSVEPLPLGKDPWIFGPNFNCPRYPVVPLTEDSASVRDSINALEAYGNMGTVIGPAVGWASRVLSPQAPFTEGAADGTTQKIMIVLTDGDMVTDGDSCSGSNTSEPYRFDPGSVGLKGKVLSAPPVDNSFTPYGYIRDSDPFNQSIGTSAEADAELDRLSIEACTEFKRSGDGDTALYTIGFSSAAGPGTRANKVLTACASASENHFYAADNAALLETFKEIAKRSVRLRLTN